jgi:hypothetical protein
MMSRMCQINMMVNITLVILPLVFGSGCTSMNATVESNLADQRFKTAIALIELHKTRYGAYPETLNDLTFTGGLDIDALRSVKYTKRNSGYILDLIADQQVIVQLRYPAEFWQGLGIVASNMKQ